MRLFVQKIRFSAWSIPLALLAACVLAFGLLIPWLGFYYDDWHFIYYSTHGMQGLTELFNYDGHPMSVWTYFAAFNLLQYNPLNWHLFSLFWRCLAVGMFWLCLHRLWPTHSRQTCAAALLFALYPLFNLQAMPISYFEAWMSFFILMLSFFLTLEAIRQPDRFWLFTTLAILVKCGHIFTREYTWGTELMRPLLIWFMLSEKLSTKEKLRKTFNIWLPYLGVFIAMIGWRAFFYQGERKAFQAQTGMLLNPLGTLLGLPNFVVPDFGLILFSSWYPVFAPPYLNMGIRSNLFLMFLMLVAGAGLFIYLDRLPKTPDEADAKGNWSRQALILGFAGLLFGLIPAYGAGYSIYLSEIPINARLALGSIPGAALIITALVDIFVTRRLKWVVIAVLAGLLIGWHVRYTLDFRDAWSAQASFYRQLTWRVPGIEANTALITNDGIFSPVDEFPAQVAVEYDFPTALAINVLYGAHQDADGQVPAWFFSTSETLPDFKTGIRQNAPLNGAHVNAHFLWQGKNALIFSFDPKNSQCLHILDAADRADRKLPEDLKRILPPVPPADINLHPATDFSWLDTILGPENTNTWCYYYEKADLARQRQDWKTINLLWDTATQKGLRPRNEREYIPFVEAQARSGHWGAAFEITGMANKLTPSTGDLYCPLWKSLLVETPASPEKEQTFAKAHQILKCSN